MQHLECRSAGARIQAFLQFKNLTSANSSKVKAKTSSIEAFCQSDGFAQKLAEEANAPPPWQRRGGRAVKKNGPKGTFDLARTGWLVQGPNRFLGQHHPVCAFKGGSAAFS
jgi:hypothetical protein